ncbi:agmatinase [Streptomyces sp. NPDC054765]
MDTPFADHRRPGPIPVARYAEEPAWAGIQTFKKSPYATTPEDLRAGGVDVAIGGIPWDGTAFGKTGTHMGPQAIRSADSLYTSAGGGGHLHVDVDPFEHLSICDYGDADIIVGDTERTFANVKRFVGEIIAGGAKPILLGGDHGITWPNATAIAEAYGYGNVGIVHFDAHADAAPDQQGNLAGHGTPMRRLIDSGAVLGRNFVQVGLRGFWPGPDVLAWMAEQRMKTHFMAEIERHGFDSVLERAIDEALDGPEHLFLSIDIDVADPAHAPGTGTPEPGGITSRDLLKAIRRICAEVGIVGMDMVEVSPPYDVGNNITALLAHRCVMEALTGTAMRKLGLTERDYLHPRRADGPPDTAALQHDPAARGAEE